MAIKQFEGKIDVVKAARMRIQNIFKNDVPVYLSFSGGKDSLALAQLTMELIQEGKINPKQLIVYFLDEEAIYPCIEETCLKWRKRFLLAGARFEWFCIECKHYNCFNNLQNDESFICWDSTKSDVWVRRPPKFAVRDHPLLNRRVDTYQDFFAKYLIDGVNMIGVRAAESLQRRQNFARMRKDRNGLNSKYQIFPIYDWSNADVWLYLRDHKVEIPEVYMFLWQSGTKKQNLRVSQFFSIDTARSLVQMNEYYPDLMERIVKREPNAYLAALYWDSEMFGRSTAKRKELEKEEAPKDYRALLMDMFSNMAEHFLNQHTLRVARQYRHMYLKFHALLDDNAIQAMYEALLGGDPKLRTYRSLMYRCAGLVRDQGIEYHTRRKI